jgi:hypothetical protein
VSQNLTSLDIDFFLKPKSNKIQPKIKKIKKIAPIEGYRHYLTSTTLGFRRIFDWKCFGIFEIFLQ